MQIIEMPPYAPTLMESTRAIGYSSEAAIADIIDNSIAANADNIDVDFFPGADAYISILDNGVGMDDGELQRAMQYGSKSPLDIRSSNDLGRYGLGMKTASLSQCRILSVISKKQDELVGCQWNLDIIAKEMKWSLVILDKTEILSLPNCDKLQLYKSGTLIVWQDLDKFSVGDANIADSFQRKMHPIEEHLALVFHRYLKGEQGIQKLNISINNRKISPLDPFLVQKSTLLMDPETIKVREEKIEITPYILPHISRLSCEEIAQIGGKEGLRKQQGFYVYRNKRLLIWGTWFRLLRKGELSKLARVQVDIPNSLDDLWTLDIKKSTAMPPEEVRNNLKNVVNKISDGSKRTWTYRGKKETTDKIVHIWNKIRTRDGGIFYEINKDYPLVKNIEDTCPKITQKLDMLLRQISMNLPLNALFVDLTNDQKLENDDEQEATDIINLLKISVSGCRNKDERLKYILSFKLVEPFSAYTDEVNKAIERGEFDDI